MKILIPDGPIRIVIETIEWMTTRAYVPDGYCGYPWIDPITAFELAMASYSYRKWAREFRAKLGPSVAQRHTPARI